MGDVRKKRMEEYMLNSNTKKINKMIAVTLAICSLAMVILLGMNFVGFFNFEMSVLLTIGIVGSITTFTPIILYMLNVPDDFLKYYMMLWMSILIGMLGCYNGIGIYISFIIVPVASCLYFDRRFTTICTFFSYAIMCFAVYINSGGKMEIEFLGWSHFETFASYLIGFTIEYVVVSLFLNQIMRRARAIMDEEHEALLSLKAQDYRYKLLEEGTSDVVFEYLFREEKYTANHSIYAKKGEPNVPVVVEGYNEIVKKNSKIEEFVKHLNECIHEDEMESFEIDFSYDKEGNHVPLWYSCECFVVKDEGIPVSVIGKLQDITQAKLSQERLQRQRVSAMYMNTFRGKKNSIYESAMEESSNFTEEDFAKLSRGHQFIAKIMDTLKYAKNLDETLREVLESIGNFFHLDRIVIIESDMSDGTNELNYQWNSEEDNVLDNFMPYMKREDMEDTSALYDKFGYIEINPKYNIFTRCEESKNRNAERAKETLLGTQLWIPTLSDGKYNGAVFFDKYDMTPYTMVEKFLLSEVVSTLSAYVTRLNAEEANKAKSVFLSTMSHEIRTPMNAIVGMTEVALREEMSDTVRKCLKTVQSSSFGLLTLINDILDFSKIEAGKIEIVIEKYHILSMVNDFYEIVKARNNGKLELNLHIAEDFPSMLKGDIVRLKQVMINFCTNSIKYTDQGSVDVYIDCEKKDDNTCLLKFAVKDTGIGIKEEDLGKLFKSYVQVDTRTNHHKEGTGLGLAISKQLIDLMDGVVAVESEYGKGSTFSFEVPQEVLDWAPAGRLEDFRYDDDNDDAVNDFTAPDARILIVDDTEINLMVAQALLEPLCMQIDTASDGYEALKKVEKQKYDLIFMDHFMPGMDGVEVTKKIRETQGGLNQTTPIIALTADAMSGVREELLSQGMDDFLSKPIVLKFVYQVLRRWLPKEKQCRG